MLEFRKDPVIGRWVIISTERKLRPTSYESLIENNTAYCPFCKGNEEDTPPGILTIPSSLDAAHPSNWSLRVVPNKFPALQIEGRLNHRADGIYDKMNGVGAHEVIIETPNHKHSLADLANQGVYDLFYAFRERTLDLQKDSRLRYVMLFKNHGKAAGASLSHSHSQLIAMPIVPKRVMEELKGAKSYFDYKDRCIFCDILEQETEDNIRIVEENDHFLTISPYAPRFPFETWILPKQHQPFFEKTSDTHLQSLARIVSSTLKRINIVLESPPYNLLIHNAPFYYRDQESYHWHIEIMPKSTHVAGFEWGTGFYINPTPPEEAAEFLRNAPI